MPKEFEQITSYEERFGNIAIAKGFITSEELLSALKIQVQEETEKKCIASSGRYYWSKE